MVSEVEPAHSKKWEVGSADSKGLDRTSEVVGGGNLRVIMHMRK